jgi:hypothetical protein
MAANLIISHGWEELLFDGNKDHVESGITFYASHETTFYHPRIFKHAWITKENVNNLIAENGFQGDIDLLSLDIDGNDYHIIGAIYVVRRRVIICETHTIVPNEPSLTIPYKPDFNSKEGLYSEIMGMSRLAAGNLLNKKGYRFSRLPPTWC